jgi:hypothetical protein
MNQAEYFLSTFSSGVHCERLATESRSDHSSICLKSKVSAQLPTIHTPEDCHICGVRFTTISDPQWENGLPYSALIRLYATKVDGEF